MKSTEANRAASLAQNEAIRIDQLIAEAFELVTKAVETDPVTHAYDKRLNQLTGFHAIDQLTHGLWPGELTIVAGAPGVGKSAFAANIATNAAMRGSRVLLVTFETSAIMTAVRILSTQSRVDISSLLMGRMLEGDWGKTTEASSKLAKLDLHICADPSITLEGLSRVAATLAEGAEHMLVIVDGVELLDMSASRRMRDRSCIADANAIAFKHLARMLDSPVLATLACSVGGTKLGADDYECVLSTLPPLVAAAADSVMHIERQLITTGSIDALSMNMAKVILAKHSLCLPSEFKLTFIPECLSFVDYAESSYAGLYDLMK